MQDFGHVFSNIGYIIFGIAFIIIVYIRHNFDNKETNNRYNDGDKVQRGVPLDSGIYYALGATSIGEGFLSACYHVCPTTVNFQFDTTFMYTMSLLILLKMYQFRHPKATPSSFQTFSLISLILVIEVTGYFFTAVWFYIVFVLTHMLLMAYTVYHVFNKIKKVKTSISVLFCHKCVINCQCLTVRMTFLAVLVNLGLDVYILMERTPGCSSYILLIIMTNMTMYNFYYITRKLYCFHFKGQKNEQIGLDTYTYIALAVICVVFAGILYKLQNTN